MAKRKMIIVANRLPVKIQARKGEWKLQDSEGGLATGLASVYQQEDTLWIGWPGAVISYLETRKEIEGALEQKRLLPVWLSQKEINEYYEGFSNETLWPLFHYFSTYAHYNPADWKTYKEVNKKFADLVLAHAEAQDTVWIHDYQLLLVPELVRKALPEVSIGFFQHIPFPSYELFRLLPWRKELLNGLMGADLIGFHTYDDERHFISAVKQILNIPTFGNELQLEDRVIMVDAFPMGIDYEKYRESVSNEKTKRNENKLRRMVDHKKLMISIDRLDYSKGIIERLKAYETFLHDYPAFREKVVFLQLVVPSRDKVKQYAALKETTNQLISEINGRYGTLSWQPIYYFYRSFPLEMISALYSVADVALIAPLRDGMNLVCKEYVASKTDLHGVLILSEMAGASKELYDALIINPHNRQQVVEAIHAAFTMPEAEQQRRMASMQQTLKKFNVHHWVNNFMERLKAIKGKQLSLSTRKITSSIQNALVAQYQKAGQRLLFLDYDGTLIPFNNDPLKAVPDEELFRLLRRLYEDPKNKIVLISGRKRETLSKWFGGLPVSIIAEHGAWIKEAGQDWHTDEAPGKGWKKNILPVLQQYEMLTPGSFIEEKDYSLAWHYRMADAGLGERRAQEIINNLENVLSGQDLQILEGNKVLEIKSALINKGKAAESYLKRNPAGFILAIGDDLTDEDTFRSMPGNAITIKVGAGLSEATYFLKDITATRSFLENLAMGDAGT